jgi:2-amino-4-hydroxy-6-hydroxymethyldihydropteridine diphosphokinase
VARVVALLARWADALGLDPHERDRWTRAGWLHDALRDAPEHELRHWAVGVSGPRAILHGPAAAARAALEGEADDDVLSAVRWHTLGWAGWGEVGKALYAADFLEPGRPFDREARAVLAERFPLERDAVLAEVIERRIVWHEAKGRETRPETRAFLKAVQG